MPYAEPSDVIDRWIGQSPPPADQVALHIADATTLINREFPDLPALTTSSTPTADEVRLVVIRMVTRYYRNPEGISSRSIGGPDEFGGSVSYSGPNPGVLVITDDERAILGGSGSTVTGPFAIDTAPCIGDIHADVCALRFGANYCSCGADIAGFPLYEMWP